MHLVALSQRVDIDERRGERRDALDQRWIGLLAACGALPLPVPNCAESAVALLAHGRPDALILTGGNDLAAYGGNAPERDAAEAAIVAWARTHRVPVLGVCRGMQMLVHLLGGTLRRIGGHAGTRHRVQLAGGTAEVNSYHDWAVDRLPPGCLPRAVAEDGSVEGFQHDRENLTGLMWHPEREPSYAESDLAVIRDLFVPHP
ncbi:MAG: gamma-glutamyl-gamma-aminobutyrate hydrolase family protein [Rhodospirillaceae bacterium]|nr:gamma-glutamyl-gamma-aminobutyrate hydrolase family protein [Rhodospirillaceae bacterium]